MDLIDLNSECAVKPIPVMCSGSVISGGSYAATARPYNIGKLRAVIPSYDPTNRAFSVYQYDVKQKWSPTVYTISGGVIRDTTPGSITSGGGAICGDKGYDTQSDEYTLVSWYLTAISGSAT